MTTELVLRAQRGDHGAFERIATELASRMYGTASLIVRDPDAARDAVQEALIEIWRSLPALRDPAALEAWARRILVRCCYRAIRQRTRLEVSIDEIDPASRSFEAELSNVDQLERAFRRLPVEQRTVLVLHHRLGLQLVEIAAELGVPVGTVKSRLSRASAALRAALAAEDRDAAVLGRQMA